MNDSESSTVAHERAKALGRGDSQVSWRVCVPQDSRIEARAERTLPQDPKQAGGSSVFVAFAAVATYSG